MPVKTDVREQVIGALEECQRGLAVHRKCIVRLKQAQIADPEEFWETFVECLNRALLVFKIDPAIERFMRLVAGFVSFTNEKYARDGEMASSLLEYMIPLTASKDKAVRFRTCQLTSRLLNGLGDDSEVLAAHTFTDPRIPTTREAAGLMGVAPPLQFGRRRVWHWRAVVCTVSGDFCTGVGTQRGSREGPWSSVRFLEPGGDRVTAAGAKRGLGLCRVGLHVAPCTVTRSCGRPA